MRDFSFALSSSAGSQDINHPAHAESSRLPFQRDCAAAVQHETEGSAGPCQQQGPYILRGN